MIYDKWQLDVLEADGNICLCSGRQVGKSEIIAHKSSLAALKSKKRIFIISITESQAELMLQKIVNFLQFTAPKLICRGGKRPTKHKVQLTNGSVIITKAVGSTGWGAMGDTIDILIPDEAAYLPELIWASITPMLLTTGGVLWLLSTPNAQEGYFYEAYTNPAFGFKTFHVNSEEVAEGRPEPQRSIMLQYLAREKERMSPMQYAQQYLAQFQEELGQLFPDELIQKCQTLKRPDKILPGVYFLGEDVARMGGDELTFEVLERKRGMIKKYVDEGKDDEIDIKIYEVEGNVYYHRENLVYTRILTTFAVEKNLELDRLYDFRQMYIDDGGLGVAVFDPLLNHQQTKNKVVAINNASRSLEFDNNRKRKLLKEDLYMNLLRMMESGEIELLDDPEIFTSLKSIMVEHDVSKANIKIYGRYSHITEGLIRAAWSNHSTRLALWVR